jgi:serine/threonine protein kinase
VYLGEWEQQKVAVKIVQDNSVSGVSSAVKEFCREVQVLSKLRHPNVCTFLGANISPPR